MEEDTDPTQALPPLTLTLTLSRSKTNPSEIKVFELAKVSDNYAGIKDLDFVVVEVKDNPDDEYYFFVELLQCFG